MSAEITFPITTILNESGTYTSDQNHPTLDGSNVRSLMAGVNVTALTGSTGVDLSIGGYGPDGVGYELGRISNLDGNGIVRINGPIPATLSAYLALNGASSATVSFWLIGQA